MQYVDVFIPGSAIYVYGILSNSTLGAYGASDISFFIDDVLARTFSVIPSGPEGVYSYNQLLLSVDSLEDGPHKLVLQNGHIGGAYSLVLLDYIIYTANSPSPSVSKSSILATFTSIAAPSSTETLQRVISKPCTSQSFTTLSVTSPSPPSHLPTAGRTQERAGAARAAIICVATISVLALAVLTWKNRKRRQATWEHADHATAWRRPVPHNLYDVVPYLLSTTQVNLRRHKEEPSLQQQESAQSSAVITGTGTPADSEDPPTYQAAIGSAV
ncbi:hypothetical protein PsYK624_054510 [Phanerochaete sordida]|uniref:Uncharacterized protein n=1 Tax=Phanerochaete sordida TaxID=48140 RepID=A0A9P3LCY6_9APHY|nr:hypothetical protein PsYK624_054510 [Phanerochaete sordida]